MNSAPSRMKSAATDTSEEIRNSAECTALRAMTVKSPARIAAIEKIQKKTDSQPERIICFGGAEKTYLSFVIGHLSFVHRGVGALAVSQNSRSRLIKQK